MMRDPTGHVKYLDLRPCMGYF